MNIPIHEFIVGLLIMAAVCVMVIWEAKGERRD